jgi:TPR repeat protein
MAQIASAGPFEDGTAAYDRGDYATALKRWRPLADQGNAHAQNRVGGMYYRGNGVAQDFSEAVKWCSKAADRGDVDAQSSLGHMYYRGNGVAQDYKEAAKWFRKAADQWDATAQSQIGFMYEYGKGVVQPQWSLENRPTDQARDQVVFYLFTS